MKRRKYGWDMTIHGSSELDIETDDRGLVVAVWFRCQALPFSQVAADEERANEMHAMYMSMSLLKIVGLELEEPE